MQVTNLSHLNWRNVFGPSPRDPELQPVYNKLHPTDRQSLSVRWDKGAEKFGGVAMVIGPDGSAFVAQTISSAALSARLLLLGTSLQTILGPKKVTIFKRVGDDRGVAWAAVSMPVGGGTGNQRYLHPTPFLIRLDGAIVNPEGLDETVLSEVSQVVKKGVAVFGLDPDLAEKLPADTRQALGDLIDAANAELDLVETFAETKLTA